MHPVGDVLGGRPVGVDVHVRGLAALAAEQVVDGHARLLALDVPQRLIHTGDGVVQHRPVAPVPVHHRHLPDLLDARDVATDQERLEVVLDSGGNRVDALGEGRTSHAVQPGLGRHHLDDREAGASGLGQDDLNVFDGGGLCHGADSSGLPTAAATNGQTSPGQGSAANRSPR